MREILFRGKRKNDGEWVCGFYERTWLTNGEVIEEIRDVEEPFRMQVFHEVIPETVGQYTGLTDRNGKRIFEGDILSERPLMNNVAFVGKVVFNEDAAAFQIVFDTGRAFVLGSYSKSYTVIGNIHDNPELIKDGEQNAAD